MLINIVYLNSEGTKSISLRMGEKLVTKHENHNADTLIAATKLLPGNNWPSIVRPLSQKISRIIRTVT